MKKLLLLLPLALIGAGAFIPSSGQTAPLPDQFASKPPRVVPVGATAECRDGTFSYSKHRQGTCSHHQGVKRWL